MNRIFEKAIGLLIIVLIFSVPMSGSAQQASTTERVAAIKQLVLTSAENIKNYTWTETISVSLKGEEKSNILNQCWYGADGVIEKTAMDTVLQADKKPGLRGRAAERKKDSIEDYMDQCVNLIGAYIPVSAGRLQILLDDGKVGLKILEPNKRILVQFNDYQKSGDIVGIELDVVNNVLLGYEIASYIDKPEDAVNLNVRFATLEDATLYPAELVLDANAKSVKVHVLNSEYTK